MASFRLVWALPFALLFAACTTTNADRQEVAKTHKHAKKQTAAAKKRKAPPPDDYRLTDAAVADTSHFLGRVSDLDSSLADDADRVPLSVPAGDPWLENQSAWLDDGAWLDDTNIVSTGRHGVQVFVVAAPDTWSVEQPEHDAAAVRPLIQGENIAGVVNGSWVSIGVSEFVPLAALKGLTAQTGQRWEANLGVQPKDLKPSKN